MASASLPCRAGRRRRCGPRSHFLAQGLDDGGQDQALDIGPRGVVGAEAVALQGVQGAFEQGAEDGGLDIAPVGTPSVDQQVDLRLVERQGLGLWKRPPLKRRTGPAQDGGEGAAMVHVAPQVFGEGDELGRVVAHGGQKRSVKPAVLSRPTSSANRVKRQRIRKAAASSGGGRPVPGKRPGAPGGWRSSQGCCIGAGCLCTR